MAQIDFRKKRGRTESR